MVMGPQISMNLFGLENKKVHGAVVFLLVQVGLLVDGATHGRPKGDALAGG